MSRSLRQDGANRPIIPVRADAPAGRRGVTAGSADRRGAGKEDRVRRHVGGLPRRPRALRRPTAGWPPTSGAHTGPARRALRRTRDLGRARRQAARCQDGRERRRRPPQGLRRRGEAGPSEAQPRRRRLAAHRDEGPDGLAVPSSSCVGSSSPWPTTGSTPRGCCSPPPAPGPARLPASRGRTSTSITAGCAWTGPSPMWATG
jgi:hypothetical protein